MNTITYMQSLELIDLAAKENRLYHHNGGQAYIKMLIATNILMIIDHTRLNKADVSLYDGTEYFQTYEGAQYDHSKRLREHGLLAKWFKTNYPERIAY